MDNRDKPRHRQPHQLHPRTGRSRDGVRQPAYHKGSRATGLFLETYRGRAQHFGAFAIRHTSRRSSCNRSTHHRRSNRLRRCADICNPIHRNTLRTCNANPLPHRRCDPQRMGSRQCLRNDPLRQRCVYMDRQPLTGQLQIYHHIRTIPPIL